MILPADPPKAFGYDDFWTSSPWSSMGSEYFKTLADWSVSAKEEHDPSCVRCHDWKISNTGIGSITMHRIDRGGSELEGSAVDEGL